MKKLSGQAPPPVKIDDERLGLNGRIGLIITTLVGTMNLRLRLRGHRPHQPAVRHQEPQPDDPDRLDAEAVLHEAIEIQKRLRAQDDVLAKLVAKAEA